VQLVRQPGCRYELISQPHAGWQLVANQLAKWNLAFTVAASYAERPHPPPPPPQPPPVSVALNETTGHDNHRLIGPALLGSIRARRSANRLAG